MAKKKNNNTLLYIGLAVGAYFLYQRSKNQNGVAVPAPVTPVALLPPSTNIAAPVAVTATTGRASNNSALLPDVLKWAQPTPTGGLSPANSARFFAVQNLFTTDEIDGLNDLVVNDWEGGQGNTAARTAFWNNWRVKYHIADGTYN